MRILFDVMKKMRIWNLGNILQWNQHHLIIDKA